MEIAVKHLCKSFGGRTVLRDLTFTAGPGITAVMAPSGTGKTTLLRILLGLERPDSGTVEVGAIRWSRVDFPAPLRPTMPMRSPRSRL